jgi:hypothetical protein
MGTKSDKTWQDTETDLRRQLKFRTKQKLRKNLRLDKALEDCGSQVYPQEIIAPLKPASPF